MDNLPDRKELKAQWKTETEVPALTLADVGKHKSKSDNWIVIHGHGEIVSR
jgi:cytochrome-b5 reductase